MNPPLPLPGGPAEAGRDDPGIRHSGARSFFTAAVPAMAWPGSGDCGVPCRDRGCQLAALRGPEQAEAGGAQGVGHRKRRGHLPVERQVDPVPVRQAAPGLVKADHREPLRQPFDEAAERAQLQLPAQMGDPARLKTTAPAQRPMQSKPRDPRT
jgi:hypothetical protein